MTIQLFIIINAIKLNKYFLVRLIKIHGFFDSFFNQLRWILFHKSNISIEKFALTITFLKNEQLKLQNYIEN